MMGPQPEAQHLRRARIDYRRERNARSADIRLLGAVAAAMQRVAAVHARRALERERATATRSSGQRRLPAVDQAAMVLFKSRDFIPDSPSRRVPSSRRQLGPGREPESAARRSSSAWHSTRSAR